MKPLTIAGGGIAGLALGIALRRRSIPVQVLEAAADPRHRVCGEFISGIKSDELVALSIDELFKPARYQVGFHPMAISSHTRQMFRQ